MDEIYAILIKVAVLAPPILVAITFHEAAHGWMARQLGDDTAWQLGRVSFNPLRHVDPVGTILVPAVMYLTAGLLFGWAKPVPVNFWRLRHPRRDMVWVALAGPGINLVLALLAALLLHSITWVPPGVAGWWSEMLQTALVINVILALFNMLPLPPLDGGRVGVGILPDILARPLAQVERFGMPLLLGLVFLLPFVSGKLGYPIDVMGWVLGAPVDWVIGVLLRLVGLG